VSLIVCIYVPNGIALSGDNTTSESQPAKSAQLPSKVVSSDATRKIFHLFDHFGVGVFGEDVNKNLPASHYIDDFRLHNFENPPSSPSTMATSDQRQLKSPPTTIKITCS